MAQLCNGLPTSQKMIIALADLTRVRLIRLFTGSEVELCLCDLTKSMQEPTYKLSRHLKVLREAGVLSAKKEGRCESIAAALGSVTP